MAEGGEGKNLKLLHHLPNDVLVRCFKDMKVHQLSRISKTCSALSGLCRERELWRLLVGKRWPCRTMDSSGMDWRGIFRAMMEGDGAWHVIVVECGGVEVPVPYHCLEGRDAFVSRLVSLMSPDTEVSHALLRRRGPCSLEPIGAFKREVSPEGYHNMRHVVSESDNMSSLRMPAITRAILHLGRVDGKGRETQAPVAGKSYESNDGERGIRSDSSVQADAAPGVVNHSMIINLWRSVGGETPRHASIMVDGRGNFGDLKRAIEQELGSPLGEQQALWIPTVVLGGEDVRHILEGQGDPASAARARGGGVSEVIWGDKDGGVLMEELPAWNDDAEIMSEARMCCGDHYLLVGPCERRGTLVIEASQGHQEAELDGPASFIVWINCPGTIDFSVDVVAHPWSTMGALVKTAAARPEWAASRHDHIFVSSGEVQMWETATQVGLAGGDRVFVEVKGGSKSGSNGLWGWEENEEVVKGILARNWVASEAQVLFALLRGHLPSTADPVPQGTSRHAVECAEMLLLRERCVLHKTSPVLLPPFCAAAQEIPRQFEYSPHTPGLMAVGSFNGKVSLVHDAGHTPFAGVTTACSNDGEVLALNWLSRHADRLLVGSCDVAGEIGTGLIQIMRVVPDGSNLRLDASNGQLNEMSWLNSICSNSTDDYFIAAGLNQVRLFDLETSKLCQSMPHWHQAFVNCPKFANRHPHLIASASLDQTLCLWDARTSMMRPCWRRDVGWGGCMLCFSPSDDTLLLSGEFGKVSQFSTCDGASHSDLLLESIGDNEGNYTKSYYTADARYAVVTGRLDDCLHMCCSRTGELVESFQIRDQRPPSSMHLLTRTSRPDPFHPHRYSVLVDGWDPLPTDMALGDSADSATLAYVLDLSAAVRDTDSEREPIGVRGICDMQ